MAEAQAPAIIIMARAQAPAIIIISLIVKAGAKLQPLL
jgi:hypothetical protein